MWIACFPEFFFSFFVSFIFHLRDQRRIPTSFLVMQISPAVFEQPPTLPHNSLVRCPSVYTSTHCLWISAGRTFLAAENSITHHTSHVVGFSIFTFSFRDYSGWGGGGCGLSYYAIHLFPVTWKKTGLHRKCATHLRGRCNHRFLLYGRAAYVRRKFICSFALVCNGNKDQYIYWCRQVAWSGLMQGRRGRLVGRNAHLFSSATSS